MIFTNWSEALHQAGLSAGVQTFYSMAISGYRLCMGSRGYLAFKGVRP